MDENKDQNGNLFKSRPAPRFEEPTIEVRSNIAQILREENTLKNFDQKDIDKIKMNELHGCSNIGDENLDIDYTY